MSPKNDELHIKENYLYMLESLRVSSKEVAKEMDISTSTDQRIRKVKNYKPSDSTLELIVNYYNKHGHQLYPHHITLEDFKHEDLSKCTLPRWENKDVEGDYIALYRNLRGTGKLMAMAIKIKESPKHTLNVRAIDIIHNPSKAKPLLDNILGKENIDDAREAFMAQANNTLLRGSRFLNGTASGRGDLLTISLKDNMGYEITLCTSLQSYLDALVKAPTQYSCRGGAAIATVCDLKAWPYTMIVGLIGLPYWDPSPENLSFLNTALERMHQYQRKENMLCLQNDIDSLWYESFMDIYHQKVEAES